MIGGMEDEERERRQREWDAWRAEERKEWDRQQRKATNRRERDDVKRGYWELTEPLTTDEEYELRNLNDFDKWEEVTTDDKKEWKLKDPDDQQRYDELYNKDQAYKGSVNFAETRLPPYEYYLQRKKINHNGLGFVGVQYEREPSTGFHYARIHFPRNFVHLTNAEGQRRKRETPAGYHVTLGYNTDYTENPAARAAIDNFAHKYGWYKEIPIQKVNVSSGDTYEIIGNSEFARDLRAVTDITKASSANYKPHISLD
jgi:hypothetical protein